MPEYSDLRISYEKDATKAVLTFDSGKQSVGIAVVPPPVSPVGPGATVVASAEQLTAALKTPGTYKVLSGSYAGNFIVTAKGVSIDAAEDALLSAKEPSLPVLIVKANDLHWTGGSFHGGFNEGIVVGSNSATTVDAQPHGVTFVEVTVEANPIKGGLRGFALHGVDITLRSCRVLNYFRKGQEVQGVWMNNGPGPYTLVDCYIEGAGENIFTGGASVMIPNCVPSDITIRRCTCYKPDRWRTDGSTVKNLLELKNAQRVVIEDSVFDNCWKGGQAGSPIGFTARNADNQSPWAIVDDVTFRHNIVSHSPDAYGINILGTSNAAPTQQMKTLTIEDNLFEHCTGGLQVGSGVTEKLTVNRNTFPAIKGVQIMFVDSTIKTNLVWTENVGLSGVYGIVLSGGPGKGEPSLKVACSAYVWVRNVIEKSVYTSNGQPIVATIPWPAGNTVLAPKGITYLPDFVYNPDGGPIEAGWSGGDVGVTVEAPLGTTAKKAAARRTVAPEPEPEPVTQEQVDAEMAEALRQPDEDDPPLDGE